VPTTFSVIIPYTKSVLLDDILSALRGQTTGLSPGEVLVLGPEGPEPQAYDGKVRFLRTGADNRCASDKRNLGIQQARGEILFFLDDDCIPRPDWIERHLERHASGELIVGGSVDFPRGNYLQLADNVSAFHFMTSYTPPGYRPYLCTANLSVHRSVIAACGGMEPGQNRAEDLEWTVRFRRNGYRLYFEPRAVVLHAPDRRTFRSFWAHWWEDAPRTLTVRLHNADLLGTPRLARRRFMYLWGSPLVAAWATLRSYSRPTSLIRFGHTLPFVYLSKLVWCWSAYRSFPDIHG
jgi:glycosyltransferase involved in cell wall biosynthesis